VGEINNNIPNVTSLTMYKTIGLKQPTQDLNENWVNWNKLHLFFTSRDFSPLDLEYHEKCLEEFRKRDEKNQIFSFPNIHGKPYGNNQIEGKMREKVK